MAIEQFWGTGRRKTSVARVRIIPGGETGIIVNKKPIQEYFQRADHWQAAQRPIEHVDKGGEFAVHVNVKGGGTYRGRLAPFHTDSHAPSSKRMNP